MRVSSQSASSSASILSALDCAMGFLLGGRKLPATAQQVSAAQDAERFQRAMALSLGGGRSSLAVHSHESRYCPCFRVVWPHWVRSVSACSTIFAKLPSPKEPLSIA